MTDIILIKQSGKVIQQRVFDVEDDLYKIASFKTKDNFEKAQIWRNLVVNKIHYDKIVVYGKTVGSAGQENKYDFPPPIDNTLFFGNILIRRYNKDKKPVDLTISDWLSINKSLFGGFEWLGDDDSEEEEDEDVDKSNLDKYGYEKDGFVVEDYEDEDEDYEDEDEDEDDEDDDDDDDDDEEDDDDDEEDEDSEEEDDYDSEEEEDDDSEKEEESELEVSAESEMKEEEYFTKIE